MTIEIERICSACEFAETAEVVAARHYRDVVAYALELREAAQAARSEMGKALYSETGVDRRGMEHAFHDLDAALATNPGSPVTEQLPEPCDGRFYLMCPNLACQRERRCMGTRNSSCSSQGEKR